MIINLLINILELLVDYFLKINHSMIPHILIFTIKEEIYYKFKLKKLVYTYFI